MFTTVYTNRISMRVYHSIEMKGPTVGGSLMRVYHSTELKVTLQTH